MIRAQPFYFHHPPLSFHQSYILVTRRPSPAPNLCPLCLGAGSWSPWNILLLLPGKQSFFKRSSVPVFWHLIQPDTYSPLSSLSIMSTPLQISSYNNVGPCHSMLKNSCWTLRFAQSWVPSSWATLGCTSLSIKAELTKEWMMEVRNAFCFWLKTSRTNSTSVFVYFNNIWVYSGNKNM